MLRRKPTLSLSKGSMRAKASASCLAGGQASTLVVLRQAQDDTCYIL